MPIKTLDEKFMHELSDIYDAEHRFLEAQQEMMKQAKASELKQMVNEHIGQTHQQIKNLEQVFELLGERAKRVKCDGAAGIVSEGEKGLKEAKDAPEIRDCLIAGSASKVEHYEISSYRGLIEGAQLMGQQEIVKLLQENLKQEEQTAKKIEASAPKLLQKAMNSRAAGA
jgi:ferritin-like metal-binding protein YciE